MARQLIWLSYDLGVRGDYAGLYSWLDSNGARECGDSVAAIDYHYEGPLIEALEADLRKAVDVDTRTRLYAIFQNEETGRQKGTFLLGRRRASAWTGYSASNEQVDDEISS